MQVIKTIAVSFLVSLITVIGGLYYYNKHYAVKVVAVNIDSYIQKQERMFVSGKINANQLKQNINRFVSYVKSFPKNTVVLKGSCVIRGKIAKLR